MFSDHTPAEEILFFIFYGITGVVPFIAALYLLLRRGNAIAPDTTPPLRLRRWAASFFAVMALAHVWWLLFYIFFRNLQSASYLVLAMVDCLLLFVTFAGMLVAMLQDRHRPVWPALMAVIPFVALAGVFMVYPSSLLENTIAAYLLLLSLLFTAYMIFAIRQYGRWLNDNYADLENKKVWLSQAVALVCMLLFILYVLAVNMVFIWLIHIVELVLVGLLLWRVETLPSLTPYPSPNGEGSEHPQGQKQVDELSTPLATRRGSGGEALITIDLAQIEQLLKERCVDTQLYLQHDLSLQQLAQTIGTNRSYLSQYFSRQGITYNIYINNLRINHFISRHQELTAAGQSVVAQQLASESGYRSYSTFSLAFKQRTGKTVTAWIQDTVV
jgi:AraC-like DNA-binding protein